MIPSNPFCTRFVRPGAVAYRFAADQSGQLDSIVKRIKGVRHGLIIGPHGSGKSTLIHSLLPILRREYPNVVCCQLCDSKSPHPIDRLRQAQGQRRQLQHCLRQLNHQDLLIIDGIEQLTVVNRIRLSRFGNRSGPSVLATCHRPSFGFQPLFETSVHRHTAWELTEQLIQNSPPPLVGLVRNKLANQDWERTTNLREFWFECYDDVQTYQQQNLAAQPTFASWLSA